MIFCHSFVSDVILRRFFTKPRLILVCDKNALQISSKHLVLFQSTAHSFTSLAATMVRWCEGE
jgi:hypothetical protein